MKIKKKISFECFILTASLCVTSGHLSQVTGEHTRELWDCPEPPSCFLMVSVMTSSFLHFVSLDLGLVAPRLAKFFFGGCFFLPATLKLPVITGLSDYQIS